MKYRFQKSRDRRLNEVPAQVFCNKISIKSYWSIQIRNWYLENFDNMYTNNKYKLYLDWVVLADHFDCLDWVMFDLLPDLGLWCFLAVFLCFDFFSIERFSSWVLSSDILFIVAAFSFSLCLINGFSSFSAWFSESKSLFSLAFDCAISSWIWCSSD